MSARIPTTRNNPEVHSRRGKRKGKPSTYVSEYDIEKAKKGTPFVLADPDRYNGPTVFIANPLNVESENTVYVFQFGAYGDTWVAVLNENFDDALDIATEWLAEYAPGLLVSDEEMKSAYDEALKELVEGGADPDDEQTQQKAQEQAETDLTYTESGYLRSWEWHGGEADNDLAQRIVNKSSNIYRKEYGDEPNPSRARRGKKKAAKSRRGGKRRGNTEKRFVVKKGAQLWDVIDTHSNSTHFSGSKSDAKAFAKRRNERHEKTEAASNPKGKHMACGDLSAKQCRQLQHVYESERARGLSKQRAAQAAWSAVGRSMNPPSPQSFRAPAGLDVVWSPLHNAYAVVYGDGPMKQRQVVGLEKNPARVQAFLDNPSGARGRMRNGAGWGAFLGSLAGVVLAAITWSPLGLALSMVGGALGGHYGAPPDRRKRGAVGGAIGGAVGPLFAGLGGYLGGRHPDRKHNPQQARTRGRNPCGCGCNGAKGGCRDKARRGRRGNPEQRALPAARDMNALAARLANG